MAWQSGRNRLSRMHDIMASMDPCAAPCRTQQLDLQLTRQHVFAEVLLYIYIQELFWKHSLAPWWFFDIIYNMIDPAPTPKFFDVCLKAVNSFLPRLLPIANICFWYGCITASFPFCLQRCHFWTASCKPYEAATHGMLPGAFASFMSDVYHYAIAITVVYSCWHTVSPGVFDVALTFDVMETILQKLPRRTVSWTHIFCAKEPCSWGDSWWPLLGIVKWPLSKAKWPPTTGYQEVTWTTPCSSIHGDGWCWDTV